MHRFSDPGEVCDEEEGNYRIISLSDFSLGEKGGQKGVGRTRGALWGCRDQVSAQKGESGKEGYNKRRHRSCAQGKSHGGGGGGEGKTGQGGEAGAVTEGQLEEGLGGSKEGVFPPPESTKTHHFPEPFSGDLEREKGHRIPALRWAIHLQG